MKQAIIFGAAAILFGAAWPSFAQKSPAPETAKALEGALAPLKSLNPDQMKAAATLAAAYRAGMDVDTYCPPLKAISGPSRYPCLAEIGSLASAEKGCNDKTNRLRDLDCRKQRDAEAALVACETKRLMADLAALGHRIPGGVPQGPQPGGPGPQPGPGPKPTSR
jgi:hypothetical protein